MNMKLDERNLSNRWETPEANLQLGVEWLSWPGGGRGEDMDHVTAISRGVVLESEKRESLESVGGGGRVKDLEVVYANEKFENDHSPISEKQKRHHVNPREIQNHQKRFRQRLVSFTVERAERAECTERESDEERTRGTGGVFNTREGGETGVDLVV